MYALKGRGWIREIMHMYSAQVGEEEVKNMPICIRRYVLCGIVDVLLCG